MTKICTGCEKACPFDAILCEKGLAFAEAAGIPIEKVGKGDREADDVMAAFLPLARLHHHWKKSTGRPRLLTVLLGRTSMTQRELQEAAGMRSSSMSELLGKMEKEGSIVREKGEDQRTFRVILTDKGRMQAREYERVRKFEAERLLSVLTQEERQAFAALLRKLYPHWLKCIPLPEEPCRSARAPEGSKGGERREI
ncbi:MarR family winged helix-turn-helix transcriptional regulator [Gehongia tenuis]|uniref:Winged helix-turn-helix transcriptional regulator n=1 Tax=Gehongia tenuis TaxID=2763655 RepID=A0A926D351_9FIRM|nr:MarR family winged helix-turn-helix transcriptional regulator [Gehongia tenuis]MBC8530671.1 winged helix-turn-helix transcriptional regulator [Gehongia tenuis]